MSHSYLNPLYSTAQDVDGLWNLLHEVQAGLERHTRINYSFRTKDYTRQIFDARII